MSASTPTTHRVMHFVRLLTPPTFTLPPFLISFFARLFSLTVIFFAAISMLLLLSLNVGWGQSYLGLDGGFEGSATIDNANTYSAPQSSKWSKANVTQTIANETTIVRSGSNSLKATNGSTGRRIWSPNISVASTTSQVTVQFYIRVASTTNSQEVQPGIQNNTEGLSGTYSTGSANDTWTKITYSKASSTFTSISGLLLNRQIGTGGNVFIDDMAAYNGAVDNTAPSAPTSPTAGSATTSSLLVSWTAASGGVDGGGYLVVRHTADPTTAPNVNGIYAVNNTIGSGTVVYQGTNTSFTDNSLASGTTYYYRIYTYDKAYNYSSAGTVNGTTLSSFTVTFNGNGATSGSMSNQTASSATALTSNAFTCTGYTFAGWNTTADGSGTSYADGASYSFTSSTTLYAQWTLISSPTITTSGTLAAVNTTYGTASASPTSFSVSGSALTNDITITPPSGYEVSTTLGSGYTTSLTLVQSSGSVASTTVYVRLAATTAVGSYSGNILVASTGAAAQDVATVSSSVSAKGLTITGITASDKVYDATTAASLIGTAVYSGLVNGESFSVSGTPSAIFATKTVGTGKSVTVAGYTAPSSNYTIAQPTGLTATITAKTLTIAGATASNKTYDGTTTATVTGTLSGVIAGDVVSLSGSGTFASANVGTGITVTFAMSGADLGNYSLTQPSGLTANISAKALTITANNVVKEFGSTLTSGSGSTAFTASGLVASQTIGSVTLTYGTGAASTDAIGSYAGQVIPSIATGGSFTASNYSISYVSGDITVQNTTSVVISSFCSPFTENFNTLAISGTSNTSTPTGWYFSEANTNANTSYTAGTGSDNAGDSYSFGAASNSDRALGGLRTGNLVPTIGAKFANNTGSTITNLNISYTGETWRVGSANRSDRLDLQYSINATSLTTGTWTDVNTLDYANPGQATGSGSVQHSASISGGISGLSIANGSSFWIRWSDFDATSSDDGMGVDDFSITACECSTPDALAFVQQPTNVSQGAAMAPAVTIKAICASTGGTATNYTGNITLTASGGGCGYVSQTVAAVNGIATFNNIVFTRSTQTGITLTAAASGLTNAVSSAFNVTSGGGSITSTDIRNDNFSGSSPMWSWTSADVSVGSGGTSGSDVTGLVTLGGNTYLRKSYSVSNASSEKGTKTTITFANTTSLSSYNTLTFIFKIASLNSSGSTTSCTGCGVDSPDSLFIETSVNGGVTWQRILTHLGSSDKLFAFGGSALNLTYGTNTILGSSSTQSAFSVSIPSGTSQFQFRMITINNRTGENWCIDDVKLIGESYSGAVTSPLPTVSTFGATNICAGSSAYLYSSVSDVVGSIAYNWSPSTGLSEVNTEDVSVTLNSTQNYTITITDGDNCSATSNAVTVTVDAASTPAGDWLGTYSNDWFDCRNWKGKVVPSSETDVTILNGSTFMPQISQTGAYCRALTIQNSAILTVNDPTSTLEIYGAYTNNGSLSHSNGEITLTGNSPYDADCGTSSPFYNLKINNTSLGGIILTNKDMVIANRLTLIDGVVTTNNNKVIMNSTDAGNLVHSTGNSSFIFGTYRRYIASNTSTYKLPVGLSTATSDYRRIDLINNNLSGVTYIDASVSSLTESGNNIDSRVACSQEGSTLINVIGNSVWSLVPDVAPSGGSYGVRLYVDGLGMSAADDNTFCPVKRNTGSTDYADWNTFFATTTIPNGGSPGRVVDGGNGYAQRLGYTSFSEHAIGKTPTNQPLPVELVSFTAECLNESKVQLQWITATEHNSSHFVMERSVDGDSWSIIGVMNASGYSNELLTYHIEDRIEANMVYYRLSQVDVNGEEVIYAPISLLCNTENSRLITIPNPSGKSFTVAYFVDMEDQPVVLQVTDAHGKSLYTETHILSNGVNSILISGWDWAPGIYFVKLVTSEGKTEIVKHQLF